MKKEAFRDYLGQVQALQDNGTAHKERMILTSQSARITTSEQTDVLNMCANNYLGLANDLKMIEEAKAGMDRWGFGTASARFICGTMQVHRQLEERIASFLGTEDAILYNSCSEANGGLFATLLGPEDAIISDQLNHASIIDGVRLCKAQRFRYKNSDMEDLRKKLEEASSARYRMICTDGVFSMDGYIAKLREICDLADEYDAMVMVDDSHAVGFVGENGRGTHEYCGVMGRVDILTGTLGKALGGGAGGYTASNRAIVELLKQKSRTYTFTTSLPPAICVAGMSILDRLTKSHDLKDKLEENTKYFRSEMAAKGFDILPGEHPITPVMLYDAKVAEDFSARMLEKGVFVVSLSFPVVPRGEARIRTQISAAHSREDLDFAIKCFVEVRDEMGLQ
jgi:glycine C-acetyltransferase